MAGYFSGIILDCQAKRDGELLLRAALSLSALTQQGVILQNIRDLERKPGLKTEDLILIEGLAKLCRAKVVGNKVGAQELHFIPQSYLKASDFSLSLPGSVVKMLQFLLPVLARSASYSKVTLQGEVYSNHLYAYDHFEHLLLTLYRKFGLYAYPKLLRFGFGRMAKGEVEVEVEPSKFQSLEWSERGPLRAVRSILKVANVNEGDVTEYRETLCNLFESARLQSDSKVMKVSSSNTGLCLQNLKMV